MWTCPRSPARALTSLLELLVLQAEVLELKANPKRTAKGNVIESGLSPAGRRQRC